MRRRTRARETALQFLYQLDQRGESVLDELSAHLDEREKGHGPDPDGRAFAQRLVIGTWRVRAAIDETLKHVARNWELKRMAVVDRNVLRMATFELLHCPDIPPKVTINEAIELGKKFSTANSGGFVNGILDRIRIDLVDCEVPAARDEPSESESAGQ
jgi:transcription antitermination factor NusB